MRILVIDDEPDVIEVVNLCFNLRWPEAEVSSVNNGDAGIKFVEQEPPDLVLLDIVLPGMDGFQACQEIRQISDVPIIMLSGRDSEVDKVRGLEMGADDYITKPFSHLELLARVRAVLRRYRSQLPAVGEVFESGDLRIDYASRQVLVRGQQVRLTPTEYSLPTRKRRRARSMWRGLREKTPPVRAKMESAAISIASSKSLAWKTLRTGPKISSWARGESRGTSVKTVGGT